MAFVKEFQHDVFISYAHADNGVDDWIPKFERHLRAALKQRLGGVEPKIYFDAKDLKHHQLDTLLDAARNSALFVAIASPSYAAKPWTQQELDAFLETKPDKTRFYAAECLPLTDSDGPYPDALENCRRLPFWRPNKVSANPMPLTPGSSAFKDRINDLAVYIKEVLHALHDNPAYGLDPLPAPPVQEDTVKGMPPEQDPIRDITTTGSSAPKTNSKCVLLAQVTDDLEEEREKVRRHLEQYGITVLPDDTYPQGGGAFKAAFGDDLAKADYFVQLLGTNPGKTPRDLPEGYIRFQCAQALQSQAKVLQWRYLGLDPETVHNSSHRLLLTAETVMSSTLESFKTEIVKLVQTPAPVPIPPKSSLSVFINADKNDLGIAEILQTELGRYPFPVVLPLFGLPPKKHRENLNAKLKDCDVLLWVYGSVMPDWVQTQLLHFNKLRSGRSDTPHLLAVCIGLPPEPPNPKPDICMTFPELRHIDCRSGGFAELHALFEGLCS